jgi:hypothetical protein
MLMKYVLYPVLLRREKLDTIHTLCSVVEDVRIAIDKNIDASLSIPQLYAKPPPDASGTGSDP